ncbi:hypothetical protein D9613_009497 [Agrocybe pediades]|uniref:Uncharacterized protein n=1 Tax=Agrocybe pediades TaxID=84607 RepID=A0A8H4R2Z5_9AGAR|nr:hypothetical protein D9613_009497 [Agrocybe pediades]
MANEKGYYPPPVEKPGKAHYNSYQSHPPPQMPQAQPYYPQGLQQHHQQYSSQQYQGQQQPQVIYVQSHQQNKPQESDSCCLPCAW